MILSQPKDCFQLNFYTYQYLILNPKKVTVPYMEQFVVTVSSGCRCIKVENFKVNRIKGNNEESTKDIKTIPVTSKMKEILDELNFQENINSDKYLIGADEQSQRDTIGVFTSKAFTHFWKHTGSKRKVNLKHLRKTYLTALVNHFGDKATIISDHADIEIVKKHYMNNEVIMKANQDFNVF